MKKNGNRINVTNLVGLSDDIVMVHEDKNFIRCVPPEYIAVVAISVAAVDFTTHHVTSIESNIAVVTDTTLDFALESDKGNLDSYITP